jgi:hypothetical protein
MRFLLLVLAVAGFLAVFRQLLYAAFRVLRGSVDAFLLREAAGARAARGDVTGLAEARAERARSRSARLRAAAHLAAWVALLSVPFLVRPTLMLFAAYSVLWLIPLFRRLRA